MDRKARQVQKICPDRRSGNDSRYGADGHYEQHLARGAQHGHLRDRFGPGDAGLLAGYAKCGSA
ncbi:hypothetical protein D1872_321120 [compost metagenome]